MRKNLLIQMNGPANVFLRAIQYYELIVLLGIQLFWIMHKSSPFPARQINDIFAILMPVVTLLMVGVTCSFSKIKIKLQQIEWSIHLLSCVLIAILLMILQARDELAPSIPFGTEFFLWNLTWGAIATSNLTSQTRSRAFKFNNRLLVNSLALLLAGIVCGIFFIFAISPIYCLCFSFFLHSILIPTSLSQRKNTGLEEKYGLLFVPMWIARAIFLAGTLCLSWYFRAKWVGASGSLEETWGAVTRILMSSLFYAGLALAILTCKRKLIWVGDVIALVLAYFAFGENFIITEVLIGYSIIALICELDYCDSISASLIIPIAVFAWVLGWFLMTYVMVLPDQDFFIYKSEIIKTILLILLGIYLVGEFGGLLFKSRFKIKTSCPCFIGQARRFSLAAFMSICILLLAPMAVFLGIEGFPNYIPPLENEICVNDDFCGICQATYGQSKSQDSILSDLGPAVTRVDFSWRSVQKSKTEWDFSRFDRIMDNANKHGLKVIALLLYDHDQFETDPVGKTKRYIAPCDVPAFLKYVRRTVLRYKDRVAGFEIWNEANYHRFWEGTSEEFYSLHAKTVDLIRRLAPKTPILATSMAKQTGIMFPPEHQGLFDYGKLHDTDVYNFHLYIYDTRSYWAECIKHKRLCAKNDFKGKIAITETGAPDGGHYPWQIPRKKGPANLIKIHATAAALGISNLVWYHLADAYEKSSDSEGYFGLIQSDKTTYKPTAWAYKLFAKHCPGKTICRNLVKSNKGVTTTDLTKLLFRDEEGNSVLIMWYDSTLLQEDEIEVKLNLNALTGTEKILNISTGDVFSIIGHEIQVSSDPVFITFIAKDITASVGLEIDESKSAILLIFIMAAIFFSSLVLTNKSICNKLIGEQ